MLKYDDGVILIEMLVSIIIIGTITLLLANLISSLYKANEYDKLYTKQLQVSSLMYDDFLSASEIRLEEQCLIIDGGRKIEYCFENNQLVRTVDNLGYERLIANANGKFVIDTGIYLEFENQDKKIRLPLWSEYE